MDRDDLGFLGPILRRGHGSGVRSRSLLPLVTLLAACDGAAPTPETEPRPSSVPAASSEVPAARDSLRAVRERSLASPARFREQRCAAGAFETVLPAERELWLRVVDARNDTRHVLPLRITSRLAEPDLNELESVLSGVGQPEERPEALDAVEALVRKRFVGVYHVIHYVSPKWVVRAGHAKPSWDAGRLDAWFMLHDARTGAALCGTRLVILGDATGAPRAIRLRSQTREQMQAALGDRLRRATPAALARIGADLAAPAERAGGALAAR
jgi:hypothetical protein